MTIREIETMSGMTRANIRFYEAEGLLKPAREENGYRDYSVQDLETLKRIRLLRTLQFSLAEIKELQSGKASLKLILEKHLQDLAREHQELDRAGETCRAMREEQAEFDTLDAQRYLDVYERVVQLSAAESEETVRLPVAESEQPAWMRNDTAQPVCAPWRRFFARLLDLAVYELCLNAVLMLGFRINTERISSGTQIGNFTFQIAWLSFLALAVMLFLEPLLLSVFATTPGKWLMGFRVTDNDGYRLSYPAALSRTWTVLWRGCGLGIPVYALIRSWKSYRDCRDGGMLDWEYDTELTQKDECVWRIAALVCAFLLLSGADNLVSLEAVMPRHRGDLTAEEFYANYNQLASWYGLLTSTYRLGNDGHWHHSVDASVTTEIDGLTLYLGSGPTFLDFDLTEKDGVVTAVSFHYETTDSSLYVRSYQDQMLLTTMSFACVQKGFGLFSSARQRILNVAGTYSGESYTYTCNGITIDYQVEYSGYMMLPYDDILAPGENPSYSMTFTITKDE